jgi:uncharacterized protein YjiS (DUF1127 family)
MSSVSMRNSARLADRRPHGGHGAGLAWMWSRLVQAYRANRQARYLAGLSDHLLKDIGLVCTEVARTARRSLSSCERARRLRDYDGNLIVPSRNAGTTGGRQDRTANNGRSD